VDLGYLDAFSRSFCELLFAQYPQWRSLTTNRRECGEHDYAMTFVPPPAEADLSDELWISTENSEVTVGIDYFHQHFNPWNIGSPPGGTAEWDERVAALHFIHAIIGEELALVSLMMDDRCLGAWPEIRTAAIALTPETLSPENSVWMPLPEDRPAKTLRIRSWNGTLNRDLNINETQIRAYDQFN
jgi:hypothetical protein